jgi:hypothetical protein
MANGGASFVPMTNSCCDDTEEFAVSVVCARLGPVKISTAAANAGTMGYLHIITRRKGSLFLGTEEAVHDRGCVKTQKTEKRREYFFLNRAILNVLANLCATECDIEECSFCRRCASRRFYTASTLSGRANVIDRYPLSGVKADIAN